MGEALGVFDRYLRRESSTEEARRVALRNFLAERRRLASLGVSKVAGTATNFLREPWGLVERRHIYRADVLQMVSEVCNGGCIRTADENLCEPREGGLGVKCLA